MEYIALKDICDVRDGTHDSPKYVPEGFPLVTSKNIVDGKLDLSTVSYLSQEDYDKINERSKVDEGDIIMPMIGTIGNVALIKFPNKEISNKYIWYFLKSGAFKKYVTEKNKGGTQKFLSLGDIRNMMVPNIPFSEQLPIVERLDAIYKVIKQRTEELSLLDELIKARFVELFGNPIVNEKCWDTAELNSICDGIGDGLHGTPEYDENGDYPFINGNNLMNGAIEITPSTKMVDEATYKKHYIELSRNAILLSINGTLGKLAFYNGEAVMLGKSACYCNLKSDINRDFVYGVMRTDTFMEFLESNATASTIKNVGLKAIRGFKLIMPPEELQIQFVEFSKQVDKSKVAIQKSLVETQLLFDSLMQKYFG